jgi:hypothetical protein
MTPNSVSFRGLLAHTFALIANDASAALVTFGGIVAVATAFDIAVPNGGNLVTLPVMVVQYYMIRRLVDRLKLRSAEGHAGFGSFFVLGLITGLPTLLGYVALIVPGIYLSARWTMADVALLAENEGAGSAAHRSWSASAGRTLPIVMAQFVLALPLVVGLVMIFSAGFSAGAATSNGSGGPLDDAILHGVDFAFNILVYASQVAGWYLGVAAYALIVGQPTAALSEIFE